MDTLPDTGDDREYDKATEALDAYFIPAVNVPYERPMFRRMIQEEEEGTMLSHQNVLPSQPSAISVIKKVILQMYAKLR